MFKYQKETNYKKFLKKLKKLSKFLNDNYDNLSKKLKMLFQLNIIIKEESITPLINQQIYQE